MYEQARSYIDTLRIAEAGLLVQAASSKLDRRVSYDPDTSSLWRAAEKCELADSALWNRLIRRIEFCKAKGYRLYGPDLRVPIVLEHGEWTTEWIEPTECGTDTCLTWIYLFGSSDEYPEGRAVICESGPGQDFPRNIVWVKGRASKPFGPLFPYVTPVLLPNWDSDTHFVSVSITVPGDQISQSTFGQGYLEMELFVYSAALSGLGRLVGVDRMVSDLRPLRLVLARAQKDYWQYRGASGYLSCALPPGEYSLVVEVRGARNNEGRVELPFNVPVHPALSDLILIRELRGIGVDSGVTRGAENFYSVARPEFVPSTELTLRMEIQIPPMWNLRYHVWASFITIPDRAARDDSPRASVMDIVYWEDSNGIPRYGSKPPPELVTPPIDDPSVMTVIDRDYTAESARAAFQDRVRLPSKPGRYLLSVQIADCSDNSDIIGTRGQVIRILSPLERATGMR